MKNLIHEIHRRSLWQVLGIYLAGSWVALQVVEQLADAAALPDWVQPLALVLLVIGLPIVMATAFVQEGVSSQGRADRAGLAAEPTDGETASATEDPGDPTSRGASKAPPSGSDPSTRKLFTWRRAVLGGVSAFALLGLLAGGWMASRALGVGPAATLVAQGLFDERATVLLAEFEADDEGLSRAATEAMKVDLSQSRVVRLAEPSFVREALVRMERDPETSLDADLAEEIAVREGVPAIIAGEINPAGAGYVLTAELRAAGTGQVLVSHRETASGPDDLIDALDALSKRIRERIGESVGGMRAEAALERVTTANLDALRRYSQAVETVELVGDDQRGIELLEEAIEMDPEFAMAWRKLGALLSNTNESRSRQVEALTRAFEHQDRLPARERYLAQASYYENVTNERRRAIRAYEDMLELDPTDIYALNNAGVVYANLRDFEEAERMYSRALQADSTGLPPYFNLQIAQANLGKWDEAEATLALMEGRFASSPQPMELKGWLASAQADFDGAREAVGELRRTWGDDPYWDGETSAQLARIDATQGRLREAEGHVANAVEVAERRGLRGAAVGTSMLLGFVDVEVRRDPARGVAGVEEVLDRHPLEEMTPLDRPYGGLIRLYARAGQPARARALLDEMMAEVPEELRSDEEMTELNAAIALAEARYDEAIEGFSSRSSGMCLLCSIGQLATAYDRAGQPDSAISVYERYMDTNFSNRLFFDATVRGPFLERLGQLHDEQGNLQEAAQYYAMFVELWAGADEELQPRVRAAQARLEEILGEIG